jgi:hypothetical protein
LLEHLFVSISVVIGEEYPANRHQSLSSRNWIEEDSSL